MADLVQNLKQPTKRNSVRIRSPPGGGARPVLIHLQTPPSTQTHQAAADMPGRHIAANLVLEATGQYNKLDVRSAIRTKERTNERKADLLGRINGV